jgi:hypothetical protein
VKGHTYALMRRRRRVVETKHSNEIETVPARLT